MIFRQLTVALAIGTVITASAAHAASSADYLAQREKTTVTSLQTSQNLLKQYASHAGQVIELDGMVSGIVPNGDHAAFMLRIDAEQNLLVTQQHADPDVAEGAKLHVLARIPSHGEVLEGLCVTKYGQDAPTQVSSAILRDTEMITPATHNSVATAFAGTDASASATATAISFTTEETPRAVAPAKARTRHTHRIAAKTRHNGLRYARKHSSTVRVAAKPTHTFTQKVQLYANKIRGFNRAIGTSVAGSIAKNVLLKSQKYGVDPRLVFALLAHESHFNPKAVSPVGARGLGQLMPDTASKLGVHAPFDVAQNIDGTVRYLAQQLANFRGNVAQALAAYNAGPGNVIRYGGVPPFSETQNYVRVISTHYQELKIGLL